MSLSIYLTVSSVSLSSFPMWETLLRWQLLLSRQRLRQSVARLTRGKTEWRKVQEGELEKREISQASSLAHAKTVLWYRRRGTREWKGLRGVGESGADRVLAGWGARRVKGNERVTDIVMKAFSCHLFYPPTHFSQEKWKTDRECERKRQGCRIERLTLTRASVSTASSASGWDVVTSGTDSQTLSIESYP